MTPIDRREFLGLAATGFVVAATGDVAKSSLSPQAAEAASAATYYQLPSGHSKHIAWTVDDGFSSQAVKAYIQMVKDHKLRLTFFVTTKGDGWLDNKKALQPLVESGQIQLANHTKSHVDLTKLSAAGIQDELAAVTKFIRNNFGVNPKPYFRPPFGLYNNSVLLAAGNAGYTKCIMWEGSMGDAGKTSRRGVLRNARKWMTGGRIFIAHANNMYAMSKPEYFVNLLTDRGLKTKTLEDIFG